jgi:hypothetical protein
MKLLLVWVVCVGISTACGVEAPVVDVNDVNADGASRVATSTIEARPGERSSLVPVSACSYVDPILGIDVYTDDRYSYGGAQCPYPGDLTGPGVKTGELGRALSTRRREGLTGLYGCVRVLPYTSDFYTSTSSDCEGGSLLTQARVTPVYVPLPDSLGTCESGTHPVWACERQTQSSEGAFSSFDRFSSRSSLCEGARVIRLEACYFD